MRRNHPSATLLNVLINKKITKTTNKTMGNSTTKKGNFVAIIAMIFLFAMIAFVTNLCSPMAVILKNNFSVSDTLAQVGNYGNFGAYFLMGIPAGLLIQKFGYK